MGTSLHYSEGSTRSGAGGGVSENRIPLHYVLVVIGAGMMAGGLWAPWFRINLPDGFFTQAFGAVAALLGLGAWLIGRSVKQWWAVWLVFTPILIILIWNGYVHMDRYLPAI